MMYGGMGGCPQPDPWRKRMQRTAEHLRLLDERRFHWQIARIEECLERDAAWNLEAALSSCARWRPAADRQR
jgi:hypothetical protein